MKWFKDFDKGTGTTTTSSGEKKKNPFYLGNAFKDTDPERRRKKVEEEVKKATGG